MEFEEVSLKSSDKSSIWHYYLRANNKQSAKCKKCQKILKSAGGSTGSLHKHLLNIHQITVEVEKQKHASATANLTPGAAGTSSQTLTSSDSSDTVPKKKIKLTDFYESDVNPSMGIMVSRMASVDGIAFRTFTTSEDLRSLFAKAGHKLPKSANSIRNIAFKEYEKKKQELIDEIKKILSEGLKFSISFDEWSSNRNRRYMSLTLHSQHFSGSNAFRNLGLLRVFGSMNAEKCVKEIKTILKEYGISLSNDIVAETTDGCSLMVKVGKYLNSYHQICIAHALQLAIVDVMYKKRNENNDEIEERFTGNQEEKDSESAEEEEDLPLAELARRQLDSEINDDVDDDSNEDDDGVQFCDDTPIAETSFCGSNLHYYDLICKVRKVVRTFRKSATKNDDILQKYVLSEFGQEYSLLLDSQTRWSSIATMLDRFYKLKDPIKKALIDLKSEIVFTDDDWQNIKQLSDVLNVIKTVVEALCRRDASLVTADVAVKFGLRKLQEMNSYLGNKMFDALSKRFKQRRIIQAATLLYLTNPEQYFTSKDDFLLFSVFSYPTSDEMCDQIESLIQRTMETQETVLSDLSAAEIRMEVVNENDGIQLTDQENLTNEEQLNIELKKATTGIKFNRSTSEVLDDSLKITIKVEMALFENGGRRGRYLTRAFDHLKTIPPTSVEPERIFSSAGIICSRLRSSLSDKSINVLSFLRSYYQNKSRK